jgi:ribonuclease HI
MKEAVLYCDGASSGNPGASGIGFVLFMQGKCYEVSEHIGFATNNVAEYTALVEGLKMAKSLKAESLSVFLDSELVVKQIKGLYKVKNRNLAFLYNEAMSIKDSFRSFTISHIPRKENTMADSLAKKAAVPPDRKKAGAAGRS